MMVFAAGKINFVLDRTTTPPVMGALAGRWST
jgi:hypothetical protein